MSDEVKVSEGNTWFSGQLVVYLLSLAIVGAASWYGVRVSLNTLGTKLVNLSGEVETIKDTVSELTIEQRIRNELEKLSLLDRWSATMAMERQEQMIKALEESGVSIPINARPSIRDIQRKHMPQLYRGKH